MEILILNAGSSSIKYKIFKQPSLTTICSGLIEKIGEPTSQWHHINIEHIKQTTTHTFKNHEEAFAALAEKIITDSKSTKTSITAVGHRVVHGGEQFYYPTLINEAVLKTLEQLSHLAPLHNPINLKGIQFARHYFPKAKHVAVFDTGFHHSMPDYVRYYALPSQLSDDYQIRRYGFHGINHEYVVHQAAAFLKKPLTSCHFITLHLGNGASACLIKHGKSYDTSMGFTPLPGLIMGTRCGDIDPAIVLYLLKEGLSGPEIDALLNKQSGLLGVGGHNDMRQLLQLCETGDLKAQRAIDMYVYTIQKTIGAYMSQVDKLDGLIFTGGVGENAWVIRAQILMNLQHFNLFLDQTANQQKVNQILQLSQKGVPIFVIEGNEEKWMAEKMVQAI